MDFLVTPKPFPAGVRKYAGGAVVSTHDELDISGHGGGDMLFPHI